MALLLSLKLILFATFKLKISIANFYHCRMKLTVFWVIKLLKLFETFYNQLNTGF